MLVKGTNVQRLVKQINQVRSHVLMGKCTTRIIPLCGNFTFSNFNFQTFTRVKLKKIHKSQILENTNFTQIQCKEKICCLGQNSCLDRKADKQQYNNWNSTNTLVAMIALIFILRQIQKKQYLWVNMKRKEQQIQILH